MPVTYRYEPAFDGFSVAVAGVPNEEERRLILAVARLFTFGLGVRRVLVDLGAVEAGDVEQGLDFAHRIASSLDIFSAMTLAILPARNFFFIPSKAVLALQQAGVAVMEFDNDRDAKQWLSEQRDAGRGTPRASAG